MKKTGCVAVVRVLDGRESSRIHCLKGWLLGGVIHGPGSLQPNTEVRGSELYFVSGRAS